MSSNARNLGGSEAAQHDCLPDEIEGLALELVEVAQAIASDYVPIAARADYLHAQDAHRRAVAAWALTNGQHHQLEAVRDALAECRGALDSTRVRLRG